MERINRPLELRAEGGRTLTGPAIRYSDVSASHKERFAPGAFALDDGKTRWLDLNHDQDQVLAYTGGGGLELLDTPQALEVHASLPNLPLCDRALKGVKDGTYRGLSVEFHARSERQESGIRVVERADLVGVGLVQTPSYPESAVEARGKKRWAAGKIPTSRNRRLQCDCVKQSGASKDCGFVVLNPGVFERALREASSGRRDVIATQGTYKAEDVLGSTAQGTLRLSMDRRNALIAELLEPDTVAPAVQSVKTAFPTVRPIMRPIIDWDESRWTEKDGAAVIDEAVLDSLLVKWTPASRGWGDNFAIGALIAALLSGDEDEGEGEDEETERRIPRWL